MPNLTSNDENTYRAWRENKLSYYPEHIEQITNLPVRMGQIKFSNRKLHNAAIFSSAVGLAQGGQDNVRGVKSQYSKKGNGLHFWGNKIKEVYQEYF